MRGKGFGGFGQTGGGYGLQGSGGYGPQGGLGYGLQGSGGYGFQLGKANGACGGNGSITTTVLTAGDDSFTGGSGRDVFAATSATFNAGDSLDGGAGIDILRLADTGSFDLNTLAGFSNIEVIQGTSGVDQTITLRDGADLRLMAGNGDNVIVTGATGTQEIVLSTGSNTVTAGEGATTVVTHGGTDTITGGAGLLTVRAAYGGTTVTAGEGGSRIEIGSGTTTLTAGSGVDALVVGYGRGTITVSGFAQGSDTIDVHALHFAGYDELLAAASITSAGSSTTLIFDHGATITLTGVSEMASSDFIF